MLHIELFQAAALFCENYMCKESMSSLNTGNIFIGPVNNFPRKIVLLRDQEKIPTRKVIYAHAQYFLVKRELLLPILRGYLQSSRPLNATGNWLIFSVCV
jgi:hypothetical protein